MVRAMSGPVERVRSQGVRASSSTDLVSIGFSRREEDANASDLMARRFLTKFGNIHDLCDVSAYDLLELSGLEGFEAMRAQALLELGRRAGAAVKEQVREITGPDDVVALLDHLRFEKKEHFVAILLDSKNQVMRWADVHVGTVNMSIVGPREVFREAIREGAASVILAHNHPSGDPTPSPEDIDVTRHLSEVGKMLDIPVLDHIVIGGRRAVSLRERGLVG